jgi:hypothetical protein
MNVLFGSFSNYVLALAPKFHTKNARVNVDEIDGRREGYRERAKEGERERERGKEGKRERERGHLSLKLHFLSFLMAGNKSPFYDIRIRARELEKDHD